MNLPITLTGCYLLADRFANAGRRVYPFIRSRISASRMKRRCPIRARCTLNPDIVSWVSRAASEVRVLMVLLDSGIDHFRFIEEPRACSYLPRETASLEVRCIIDMSGEEYAALLARGYRRFGWQ